MPAERMKVAAWHERTRAGSISTHFPRMPMERRLKGTWDIDRVDDKLVHIGNYAYYNAHCFYRCISCGKISEFETLVLTEKTLKKVIAKCPEWDHQHFSCETCPGCGAHTIFVMDGTLDAVLKEIGKEKKNG